MSIKSKAIRSGKWVTISTVIQTLVQFAQIAVLARLLDATAFGIVNMSAIFISFFSMFGELGFTHAIIYKQESDQKVLSTIYYISIFMGIVLFSIVCILSPFIVAFYHEPRLSIVVIKSAISFLIICFGSVFSMLLKKELRFKSIAIVDTTGSIVSFIVTVYLAFKGYKEMSLVYGFIALNTTRAILEIFFARDLFSPKLHFRIKEIQAHLKFGVFNLGETFVGFIQGNWDNIIVGKVLGARYLGIYSLALQLGYYPVSKLNPLILQVAYPLIAKLQDDVAAMKKAYLKILDVLSYFNFPLLAGLFITVETIVPIIYGANWQATFPLIKIFVFVSSLSCFTQPLFTIAYSKGKPKYLFYLSLVCLAVKIPLVFILGKYWGITGVAVALLLTELINLMINFFIVQHLVGDFLKILGGNLLKPVVFCLLMVGAVWIYKVVVGYQGIVNAVADVAIGGIVYLLLTLMFKYSFSDIKELKKSL